MRAAAAARRPGGGPGLSPPAAHRVNRSTDFQEDNGMLSSLADLMEDTDSLGGGVNPKTSRSGEQNQNFSPRHELIHGLKSIQDEFHDHLGSEWFSVSTSTSSGDGSGSGGGMSSAAPSWGGSTEAANSNSNNFSFGSSSDNNSTKSTSSPSVIINNNNNNNGALAVDMAEIQAKLEKLDRNELLTYAARITILVGNFYRMARESDAQTPMSDGSLHHSSASVMAMQAQHHPAWRPGSNQSSASQAALIELAQGSRPVSSMTTYSDMGGLQFSASTASLAYLPAVQDSAHAHIDGDIDDGTKTINDYVIVAPIGQGSFGTVELGVTLAGEPRAIKAVKRSALLGRNESAVRREIAIMKKLRHDNVVRLFEVIDDPTENMIYLVMKYCSNGPIVKVRPDFTCDTIPVPVAKTLLRQLISGLHYLHLRRVVHRDIKPDNILLDHANCPLFVDFGVSGTLHKKSRTAVNDKSIEGTPAFWAPEIFARKKQSDSSHSRSRGDRSGGGGGNVMGTATGGGGGGHNLQQMPQPPVDLMAADVYSLGATFYTAVCGIVPFVAKTQETLAEAVINDTLKLPDYLPAPWKDLFAKMMDKNPLTRIKLPALKLHAVFTEDGMDPGSPKDDIKISDRELDDSIKPILRRGDDPNSSSDGSDMFHGLEEGGEGGGGGPKTPREHKPSGGAASSKALFHRKLPPVVRKVAASSSSPGGGIVNASSPNVVSSSSRDPPPLPRSMSTSRMPLKNIVRSSDLGGGGSHLPPVNTARRPMSSK